MDDDDAWGSGWGASDAAEPFNLSASISFPPPTPAAAGADDAFADAPPPAGLNDDFDSFADFGDAQQPIGGGGDDDFGDFSDFEDAPPAPFAGDAAFEDQAQHAGPSHWTALSLDPLPAHAALAAQVDNILAPLWARDDLAGALTDEPLREVGGLAQVLVTPEARALHDALLAPALPPAAPLNWTRSRVRRQHLIALGVPVNLDEVLPAASGKPLPALFISTRPMSAPPGARPGHPASANGGASAGGSRRGSPAPRTGGGAAERAGLGPKPVIDEAAVERLLAMDYNQLTLLPLPVVEKHLADLRAQTAATSALLAHTLQARDALQQDSDMYNKLIGELIGEAQRKKTGKGLNPSRRGTMQ